MIVVTATLLFLLLVFAPIYIKADVTLHVKKAAVEVKLKAGSIGIFNEKIRLAGKALACEGTVTTDVDLKSIDKKSSMDLLKCITVEKIRLSFYNRLSDLSPKIFVFQNILLAIGTTTACNLFHCQLYSESIGTFAEGGVRVRALINFSVAELSFCLLKQGVRKWKTHKSEK